MTNETFRVAALASVILAGTVGTVFAQADTTAPAGTTTVGEANNDDDGFDLGWLGLIGLAGLAGLTRRRDTVHRTTTSTTGATGSTRL